MARTVVNALGDTLYYSGNSTEWIRSDDTHVYVGTASNNTMYGQKGVGSTMTGGAGDDIYFIYSSDNRAVENAGEGVDTVFVSWMDYTLPDNIENLIVTGQCKYAFGNSLDNIITGGSGGETIDGGAGNDVLFGGGGADTFVFSSGNGTDLIKDFSANDTIRLNGYGVTSFEQLLANAAQHGDDLWLNFANGEAVVLAGTTVDDIAASQFQLSLDRSSLTQTFADEFDALSLRSGGEGTWDANYWWANKNGSTLVNNGEAQWYIDPAYAGTKQVNPFSVENGVLTITAAETPPSLAPEVNGYKYTSGMLNTYSSFSQTYGYFEIRADMPTDEGAWPAFWLLPQDRSWPPEIDIIEMLGQHPDTLIMSAHSNATGKHTSDISKVSVPSTDGFHTYGVLWDPQHITWYFDDVAVAQTNTPDDLHGPMYMVVNLAVGGMAGTPSVSDFSDGSQMMIDYIRAYSLSDWAA